MENRRRILLVAAAVLAALSVASIVGASLYTLHWFWAVLAIGALALCLTVPMRARFALPARGAIVAGLVSTFVASALLYTSPIEVESHTMDCSSGHCKVVGTIEVNADCVSWGGVRVIFYGSEYELNNTLFTVRETVREETRYQYFSMISKGEIRDFCVEFSGDFDLVGYSVRAMNGEEKWCDMMEAVEEKNGEASGPNGLAEWEGFVDPVTLIVQDMKAQGLSDDEIVAALEEIGMGWYPETGATWVGRSPTPEEEQSLPPRHYPYWTNEEGES